MTRRMPRGRSNGRATVAVACRCVFGAGDRSTDRLVRWGGLTEGGSVRFVIQLAGLRVADNGRMDGAFGYPVGS